MATKDERTNLLSKVALFVRNPTKDWTELDNLDSVAQSGYDRSALKAAIERKRQNDFVRRREFDQLRKLRKSAAVGEVAGVRPSSFQTSSIMTDPDGRAQTLEKIDVIEAQMSQQWWKGQPAQGHSADEGAAGDDSAMQVTSTQGSNTDFPNTKPVYEAAPLSDFIPTQSTDEAQAEHGEPALSFDSDINLAAAQEPSPSGAALQSDPELEEAAIRFANGDDVGAQSVLLQALRDGNTPDAERMAPLWWGALLDAYRVSADRVGFDAAIAEFGSQFPKPRAQWGDPCATPDAGVGASDGHGGDAAPALLWSSPARLALSDMELLRARMVGAPQPWWLDWSAVEEIDPSAQPWVASLFSSLCVQSVRVRLDGVQALCDVLEHLCAQAPHNHVLWVMRLDALRVAQQVTAFESAALDYCIQFDLAPPPWMDAACTLVTDDAVHRERVWAAQEAVPAAEQRFDAKLHGALIGDLVPLLSGLESKPAHAPLLIDCQDLQRVDFTAAGSLLNWVAHQQAQGREVRLYGVHRLVAAFLVVIGINEHAQILLRPQ